MSNDWKPVVGYEGRYDVSDLGRVRSWIMPGRRGRSRTEPVQRKLYLNPENGYAYVMLSRPGEKVRLVQVHRLVLAAFVGPAAPGEVTRHLNGDKTDNRLANLALGTYSENTADQARHGTLTVGVKNGRAKIRDQAVIEAIRARFDAGETGAAIAREYGISQASASRIRNRVRYVR